MASLQPTKKSKLSDDVKNFCKKPGKIFVINNNKFWEYDYDESRWVLDERKGSEHDVTALKSTFEKLGWEVRI